MPSKVDIVALEGLEVHFFKVLQILHDVIIPIIQMMQFPDKHLILL